MVFQLKYYYEIQIDSHEINTIQIIDMIAYFSKLVSYRLFHFVFHLKVTTQRLGGESYMLDDRFKVLREMRACCADLSHLLLHLPTEFFFESKNFLFLELKMQNVRGLVTKMTDQLCCFPFRYILLSTISYPYPYILKTLYVSKFLIS